MRGYVSRKAENRVRGFLDDTDIVIDGSRPWDIQVNDRRLYERVCLQGSLGLGEAYMDGWWECEELDNFFHKILTGNEDCRNGFKFAELGDWLKASLFNRQSVRRAPAVGISHYDAGNDLFERMLDRSMTYSCGYWNGADSLEEAQEAKLGLICDKLQLRPGMKILDIGCGWGSLVRHAALNYGVSAVGLTISKEQASRARRLCSELPVEIRLQDYRSVSEKFDAVSSVGMMEHVGFKNYLTFLKTVRRCLAGNGLFVLHTIGSNRTVRHCDPWFDKYIFPNGMLPSIKQIGAALEKNFIMESWQNIGADYDHTLMAWYDNFRRFRREVVDDYGERFFRMWRYYLLSLAGGFRARKMQVWQIVLSPEGTPGGYACPHPRQDASL